MYGCYISVELMRKWSEKGNDKPVLHHVKQIMTSLPKQTDNGITEPETEAVQWQGIILLLFQSSQRLEMWKRSYKLEILILENVK